MRPPGRKTLKRLLAAVLLLSALALAGILAADRWLRSQDPRELLENIPDGATVSIGRIHQTATRDGVPEWTLTADQGSYDASAKTVSLTDLSVTYHLPDRDDVELTAEAGLLNTETNAMEASGGVVVRHSGYLLTTDQIVYDHAARLLAADTRVHIEGNGLQLDADGMTIDLDSETARFRGNVWGEIRETPKEPN